MPKPAEGLAVAAFASGLDHPRWLYVLPNGDVLVAETNTPKQEAAGGIKAWIMAWAMDIAGAGVPSPNRIVLLRDADGDGVAETRSNFLEGLNSPFGMALIGDKLYVADTDALLRFDYSDGATEIKQQGTKIADLPAGPLNYHWTKSLAASPDGSRLYVGVGSNSNAGENGLDWEKDRAQILEIDPATGEARSFATGLRNPVGLAFEPETGVLWVVVNERDELGSDLVPDYLTVGEGRRVLRLAVQLLGPACRSAGDAAKSGSGGKRDRPRLCARQPCGAARARLRARRAAAGAIPQRRVHRRARLMEPHPVQRLQGGVRAVRPGPALGTAARRADRISQRARRGARPPRRRRH